MAALCLLCCFLSSVHESNDKIALLLLRVSVRLLNYIFRLSRALTLHLSIVRAVKTRNWLLASRRSAARAERKDATRKERQKTTALMRRAAG